MHSLRCKLNSLHFLIVECEWSDYSNDTTLKEVTISYLQGCEPHTIDVYINMAQNTTAKATETFVSAEKSKFFRKKVEDTLFKS